MRVLEESRGGVGGGVCETLRELGTFWSVFESVLRERVPGFKNDYKHSSLTVNSISHMISFQFLGDPLLSC